MQARQIDTTAQTPNLKAALRPENSDIAVIQAYHAWLDAAVQQLPKDIPSSCRSGCTHCCKGSEIRTNQAEAALLSHVTKMTANLAVLHVNRNRRGQACHFLDSATGLCSVYVHRPATCRLAVSFDDPMKCLTEEYRQMLIPDYLYLDLAKQLSEAEYLRLNAVMGNEADIREFFPPTHGGAGT